MIWLEQGVILECRPFSIVIISFLSVVHIACTSFTHVQKMICMFLKVKFSALRVFYDFL